MELLEALEAMLAQNSCICHAAGMPAVEPAFQIELFQIRVISTKRQIKFIRGRRKIKYSDAGEIGASLWWFSALPGARLKSPCCWKLGCSSQVPFECLGLCFLQLSISRCSPKPLWAPPARLCQQQGGLAWKLVQRGRTRNSPSCPSAQHGHCCSLSGCFMCFVGAQMNSSVVEIW